MTVRAFIGGAGCGKTHQLMHSLSEYLRGVPLQEGQKILALTFMHGSRRRLEERLGQLAGLRGKTNCSTIDSFAWHLVRRWSALARVLGFDSLQPDQHEQVCDAAAALLESPDVCGWVRATYPVLLIDEAQDMTANRLHIVEGLSSRLEVFAAADEFQCLKEELRPNPACAWLARVCNAEELTRPQRTSVAELLDAAAAIRNGQPPKSGKAFMIQLTSRPPLAGTWLSSNLHWYGGGKSVAVITPSLGTFSGASLEWAATNKTKKGAGPYAIYWEESESRISSNFLGKIPLQEENDIHSLIAMLTASADLRVSRDISDWAHTQRRVLGKQSFSKSEVEQAVEYSFAQRRRERKGNENGWRGMTVHGAKNREFDNVIILWPAAVGGSDDQKRRLLYNAVTRAKARCLVLVQAKAHLSSPPFA